MTTLRPRRPRPRAAYTLLEVLLALTLSVLLIGLISFAVDMYWRSVEQAQENVREAQIARVVLKRIADDLRNLISENAEEIDASLVPADPLTGDGEDLLADLLTEETADSESTADASSFETIPQTLGIYGESDWIQIDTLRLGCSAGRAAATSDASTDSFSSQAGAASAAGLVTVAYYLVDEVDATTTAEETAETGSLHEVLFQPGAAGLYRREMSRAATRYAQEMGSMTDYEADLAPLVHEVEALEFAYFDGAEWLSEWDTETQGTLPIAIRVAVAITRQDSPSGRLSARWLSNQETPPEPIYYSILVHIPGRQASEDSATGASEPLLGDLMGGLL